MKKLLGIFLAAVTVFAACAGFVGCNKDGTGQGTEEPPKKEPAGTIYSLRLAYNEGFITKEDLEQIAYYNNNGAKPEEPLDAAVEQEIKETLAEYMRNREGHPYPKAKAEDFRIVGYYGEYNGCYMIKEKNGYEEYVEMLYQEEIGGVVFYYPNPNTIIVWKISD